MCVWCVVVVVVVVAATCSCVHVFLCEVWTVQKSPRKIKLTSHPWEERAEGNFGAGANAGAATGGVSSFHTAAEGPAKVVGVWTDRAKLTDSRKALSCVKLVHPEAFEAPVGHGVDGWHREDLRGRRSHEIDPVVIEEFLIILIFKFIKWICKMYVSTFAWCFFIKRIIQ